jgi:hypothetical protein
MSYILSYILRFGLAKGCPRFLGVKQGGSMETIISLAALGVFLVVAMWLGGCIIQLIFAIPLAILGLIMLAIEKIKDCLKGGE